MERNAVNLPAEGMCNYYSMLLKRAKIIAESKEFTEMGIAKRIGLTPEKYNALYIKNDGFNNQFNKNHPSYGKKETFWTFLKSGSKKLISEEKELIKVIVGED